MNDTDLMCEKIEQARAILDEKDIDVWLTYVRESDLNNDPVLELIAPSVTWQSAIIIARNGEHTAIVGRYDTPRFEDLPYTTIGYDQDIRPILQEILTKLNPNKIAVNFSETDVSADGLSYGMYLNLMGHLQGTGLEGRVSSAEQIIAATRGRKSETEIARIKQAVSTTEKLFDEVEQFVYVTLAAGETLTQRQIFDFVQSRIESLGLGYAWEKDANPIVTCGPNSAVGHAPAGDVPLERGHTLHMDLGIRENGYCSDIQRMWYVLKEDESEAPPAVAHAFQTVLGAIKAGESMLKPGVLGWQVDEVAREFIVDNGYPEYQHAFGHLLGRVAHDGATVLGPRWPKYAGICDLPVEANNVFTLELHVILPDHGMMSLEEDVLVTDNGVKYLSNPQTTLRLLKI